MRLILFLIFLFLSFSLNVSAYDIPKVLKDKGFTKFVLLKYEKKGRLEYFIFSEWRTERKDDIVTFVVEDGRIVEQITEESVDGQRIIKLRKEKL